MTFKVEFRGPHNDWIEDLPALPEIGQTLIRRVEVVHPDSHLMNGFDEETWAFTVEERVENRFVRIPTFKLVRHVPKPSR